MHLFVPSEFCAYSTDALHQRASGHAMCQNNGAALSSAPPRRDWTPDVRLSARHDPTKTAEFLRKVHPIVLLSVIPASRANRPDPEDHIASSLSAFPSLNPEFQ